MIELKTYNTQLQLFNANYIQTTHFENKQRI